MLKVAAGQARAEVLAMKAKLATSGMTEEKNSVDKDTTLIPAFISPGKTAHVDVAMLVSDSHKHSISSF